MMDFLFGVLSGLLAGWVLCRRGHHIATGRLDARP
jgi:hypothetical protein